MPIWKKEEERASTVAAAVQVEVALKGAGIRVKVDSSDQKTPGWKYNFYEMKVTQNPSFGISTLFTRNPLIGISDHFTVVGWM